MAGTSPAMTWNVWWRIGVLNGDEGKNQKAEILDMAEWQEGRRVDHSDVRDLARGQRAELFGADHAPEEGHRRPRRKSLVDLRRPGRRLAADADAGTAGR